MDVLKAAETYIEIEDDMLSYNADVFLRELDIVIHCNNGPSFVKKFGPYITDREAKEKLLRTFSAVVALTSLGRGITDNDLDLLGFRRK